MRYYNKFHIVFIGSGGNTNSSLFFLNKGGDKQAALLKSIACLGPLSERFNIVLYNPTL